MAKARSGPCARRAGKRVQAEPEASSPEALQVRGQGSGRETRRMHVPRSDGDAHRSDRELFAISSSQRRDEKATGGSRAMEASGSCLRARVELAAKRWLPTMPSRSAASALDPYAAGAHDESARRSDRGHAASDAPSGPARPPHAGFKRPSPQGGGAAQRCSRENSLVSSHMNLIRKLTPPKLISGRIRLIPA